MAEEGSGLSFDRAEYTAGADTGPPCTACNGPLGGQYWKWLNQVMCESCRGRMAQELAASQSGAAFGKATLLGGLTALGCGAAYAIFVGVTDFQLALITIGIAFVVAKVVRKASGGISGRRFQILAVVLTYLASTMGYMPGIWHAFAEKDDTHEAKPAAAAGAAAPASEDKPVAEAAPPPSEKEGLSIVGFALFVAVFLALTLAAPFLAATSAPLGLLIVGFGLWEAWRLSRPLPLEIDGPYRVTPAATGPPAA